MDDTGAQVLPDEQSPIPETPEDVAILYSWANMPGAKYRDFSASRREYRAQQRAKTAEQQRQAELEAARELEATAQREFQEAQRIRDESRRTGFDPAEDPDGQSRSYELVRRVEEQALREREEAQRRQESAEHLRVQAQRARNEMLDARKRAEEQAARYAEAAAQYHDEVQAEAHGFVPGETTDPYYYTGQVDPAYFASTPGVRTAQATRISTERRAYVYPMHPGSDDHDAGTLQSYRSGTTFAPSPAQSFRIPRDPEGTNRHSHAPSEEAGNRELESTSTDVIETDYKQDDYYDGGPSTTASGQSPGISKGGSGLLADRDILIRPVARNPEPVMLSEGETVPPASVVPAQVPQEQNPPPQTDWTETSVERVLREDRRKTGPGKLTAREIFALESDMFIPGSREMSVAAVPHPPSTMTGQNEDVPAKTEPMQTIDAAGNRRQLRRRDLPQDTRVRTVRQVQINPSSFYRPPVSEIESTPVPSNRQKPEAPPSQPFDPARIRAAVTAKTMRPGGRPLTRYAGVLAENRRRTNGASSTFTGSEIEEFDRPAVESFRPEESLRPQRNELPRALREQAVRGATTTSDTLQQSRERVASRWFALKGLMDSPHEVNDSRQTAALRTPALCVMSLSGGVGKTSIVATLGRALSAMGEKILLADTNQHGLLPYYFGARDLRPGTIRTFTPPAGSPDAPVLLVNYDTEGMGQDPAGQRRILENIGRRARSTQRVVVDIGTNGAWLARRLASLYPWVLVPVAPDMNSVVTTQAMERLFTGVVGADGHPVRPYYVLNQFDPSLPLHLDVREVLRQSLGDRLLSVMLHRSTAVSEALAEGMTVIDYAPAAAVTEDYMNLANWLRNVSAAGTSGVPDAQWSER